MQIEGGDFDSPEDVRRAGLVAFALVEPPVLDDDYVRRLIDEADAHDVSDLDAADAFADLRRHIHATATAR